MPWRTRTVIPLSHRFHEADPVRRPPLRLVARRLPDGERYVDHPLWPVMALSPEARDRLAALAPVCDPWEARLVEEAESSALVLGFRPWPEDLRLRLSDVPIYGEACRNFPNIALTRFSATAVWGGSVNVAAFEQLADEVYAERERRIAPDLDDLETLAP
ncbi:hypothetical protein [Methylobacterium planeticum]|uniref:Uncharacterized protein n=1 Tax=Methylobacterium planeticum TaxID=2615211 RepID=A0A6N6MKK0_9HYPH|nr:hypothetical protein [Methylobacterium planeticum]KAB1071149.1 hypothetical protein F6X51_19815 [Methylobacterium planeticum]